MVHAIPIEFPPHIGWQPTRASSCLVASSAFASAEPLRSLRFVRHASVFPKVFSGSVSIFSGVHRDVSRPKTMQTNAANTPAVADGTLLDGLIVERSRGHYRVETSAGLLICTIRGRLRKELTYAESTQARRNVRGVKVNERDPVAVGDSVRVAALGAGTGVIEAIVARAGAAFTRADPETGQRTFTTIAGLDQMILVFAAREPAPHLRLLDRFLVTAEAQNVEAVICLNKADQGVEPWLEARLAVYRALGYPVIKTSAATGAGVAELRARLVGRTSALLGPSGVGKSSLLNALEPGLGLRVSAVSEATSKGRHTTTGARLVPLAEGGYLADTAGIRALGLGEFGTASGSGAGKGASRVRLDRLFREFRPYLGACRYGNCRHLNEQGCAVLAALAAGSLDAERYDSYRRLTQGDE